MQGNNSEIARWREQWALEDEAAAYSFAITARHDFINARMQRQGERILRLIDEGKHEEAQALMNTDDWGSSHQPKTQQQRAKKQKNREKSRK